MVGYLFTSGTFGGDGGPTGALVSATEIAPGTVVSSADFTSTDVDLGSVPHIPWSPEAPFIFEGLVSIGHIPAGLPVLDAMFRDRQVAPFEDELEVTVELDLSATPSEVNEGDTVLIVDPGIPPTIEEQGRARSVIGTLELQQFDGTATRLFVEPEEWSFWSDLSLELGAPPQVLPVPLGGDPEEMTTRLNDTWQAEYDAAWSLLQALVAAQAAAEAEATPDVGELEVTLDLDLSLSPTPPAQGDLVLLIDPGIAPGPIDPGRPRQVIEPLGLTVFDGTTARFFVPPEDWHRWQELPGMLGASPMALPVPPGTDPDELGSILDAGWLESYNRALAAAEAEVEAILADEANFRPDPGELAVDVPLNASLSSVPLQQGDLVLLIDPGQLPSGGSAGRPRQVIQPLELTSYDGLSVRLFVTPDEWLRWRSLPEELGDSPMALPVIADSDIEAMTTSLNAGWQAEYEAALASVETLPEGQFWVSLPVTLTNSAVSPGEGDIVFLVDPGSPGVFDPEGGLVSPSAPPTAIEWRPLEGWDGLSINFWADAERYAYYSFLQDRMEGRFLLALPVVAGELTDRQLDLLLEDLNDALGQWSP